MRLNHDYFIPRDNPNYVLDSGFNKVGSWKERERERERSKRFRLVKNCYIPLLSFTKINFRLKWAFSPYNICTFSLVLLIFFNNVPVNLFFVLNSFSLGWINTFGEWNHAGPVLGLLYYFFNFELLI